MSLLPQMGDWYYPKRNVYSSLRLFFLTSCILLFCFVHFSRSNKEHRSTLVTNTTEFEEYELLSYNYRVKQNILEALASKGSDDSNGEVPNLESSLQNFITAPRFGLTLCPISKTMSTILMNVFCYLYDPTNFLNMNQSIITGRWDIRLCFKQNEYSRYDKYLESTGGLYHNIITIVRDPLSRFVSGYLDKCINEGTKCFGCDKDLACVLDGLEKSLRSKPGFISPHSYIYEYELWHMAPQTWYCEMGKTFHNMVFLKYRTGKEHYRMVHDLSIALNLTRVPTEHINYIEDKLKIKSRTYHSTETSAQRLQITNEIMDNPKLRDTLYRIYKKDYKIFEFEF